MTDNPLSLLRDAAHESNDAEMSRSTRRRILLAASEPKKRIAPWVVCLAAAVVAPAAWAATQALFVRSQTPASTVAATVLVAPGQASVAERSSRPIAAERPPPELAPVAAAKSASSNSSSTVAPLRRTPVAPIDELAMFEAAHHSHHHGEGDAELALRQWDQYLARFPNGRFKPEALYARAVTLHRLGRSEEARVALAPFARGDFAAYRRKEAIARLAEGW